MLRCMVDNKVFMFRGRYGNYNNEYIVFVYDEGVRNEILVL